MTGGAGAQGVYVRRAALRAADEHAGPSLRARLEQIERLVGIMDRPPLIVCAYDAELFGHWWHEGLEWLDLFVRKAYHDQKIFTLITAEEYLRQYPTQQLGTPSPPRWGEDAYWRV